MSKAWYFYEEEEGIIEVVFADTRTRARMYLYNLETFDNYRYIDISPRREKALDYLDHEDGYVMNWYKDEDRLPMVRDAGFYCTEVDRQLCEECCAKEWCSAYEDYQEEDDE